jgi:hypothetical protein
MPLFVYFIAAVFGVGALTASLSNEAVSPAHFVCIAH